MTDPINPNHYQSETGVECIDAIEAAVSELDGVQAVCVANVIKYVWRFKRKNGIQDLEKARWYLDKLIACERAALEVKMDHQTQSELRP
jgi:hypothetical protein